MLPKQKKIFPKIPLFMVHIWFSTKIREWMKVNSRSKIFKIPKHLINTTKPKRIHNLQLTNPLSEHALQWKQNGNTTYPLLYKSNTEFLRRFPTLKRPPNDVYIYKQSKAVIPFTWTRKRLQIKIIGSTRLNNLIYTFFFCKNNCMKIPNIEREVR